MKPSVWRVLGSSSLPWVVAVWHPDEQLLRLGWVRFPTWADAMRAANGVASRRARAGA